MKLTWQIVRKDLQRIRLPLIIWISFMIVRVIFYAMVSGLFGHPKAEWLGYLQQGPLFLLRSVIDPLIVYFLAGWLAFEDPLVERDAFWITRPISGGRLLSAKLMAVGLIFVLLPILMTLPWWLACGFGWKEIALSSVSIALPYLMVALIGLIFASLTDGFPRFLLWTVTGGAAAAICYLLATWTIGLAPPPDHSEAGVNLTRAGMVMVGVILVSLGVVFHQYLTRRLRRSIMLMVGGAIMVSLVVSSSSFDLAKNLERKLALEQPGDEKIQIKVAGSVNYHAPEPVLWVPVAIDGLPAGFATTTFVRGQWSWNGSAGLALDGGARDPFPLPTDVMRRALGLPVHDAAAAVRIGFPFSRVMAARTKREPALFRGTAELRIFRGAIDVEMPPQAQTVNNAFGSFSVGEVQPADEVLRLKFTWRRPALNSRFIDPSGFGGLYLVRRADGQVLPVTPKDTFAALAVLDSVLVVSYQVGFRSPSGARWFDGAVLVLSEFVGDRMIKRSFEIAPFQLGGPASSP